MTKANKGDYDLVILNGKIVFRWELEAYLKGVKP